MSKNKNHFFIPYFGNKRKETPLIYEKTKHELNDITTIIEPFCGSCAFSYYISLQHPKKYKYILNDNNKTIHSKDVGWCDFKCSNHWEYWNKLCIIIRTPASIS